MKQVTVRFFAAFRDAAGLEEVQIDSEASTVGQIFAELASQYSGLEHEASALVAINDQMVSWDSGFSDKDEILFFPPVAGG